MKLKHWLLVFFLVVGALYVLHNYQMHGGVSGLKSGLGFQQGSGSYT